MQHLVIGTAGHIDHGKSALVEALTGTNPDRLKEEKLRGITIDLGFAHLDLGDLSVGFVDVPGHDKFVKNMLAGVGGIDFVLLVVAADESVMPQTREHFDICRMLGIRSGIVVITKSDLVEPEMIELVREEIRELTRGSFLEGAPILPVSSRTGDGISDLKAAIQDLAPHVPGRPTDRLMRLPIDRAFSMRGFGTVVTGTLHSGKLQKDQEVELMPAGLPVRVRGIQVHGRPSEAAVAGQRTAVNLQGVDLSAVRRGMVLTIPRTFQAGLILDVRIDLIASSNPLKNLSKVRFHHETSEILARVALLGKDSLPPGESAYAQLRLDTEVLCLCGDPFIIRQFSPAVTIGGGRVLNPHPVKHKTTDVAAARALQTLENADLSSCIPALIESQQARGLDLRALNSMLGISPDMLRKQCLALAAEGKVTFVEAPVPILVLPSIARALESETVAVVEEFHGQNPLLKGISREELRERVYKGLQPEVFRYFMNRLAGGGKISIREDLVSIHGREVQLSAKGEDLRQRIESLFLESSFQPPGTGDLATAVQADPAEVQRVYFWMVKEKLLVRISEDLTYHRLTIEKIKETIRNALPAGSKFGVAEFKELFGLTRKHAIPLLEFLDRERVTRRQGNDRILL